MRLWSRNGRDWSAEFVAIAAAMRASPLHHARRRGGSAINVLRAAARHPLPGAPPLGKLPDPTALPV